MGIKRYSKGVQKTQRWKAVRLQAKRRDGWKCVTCGSVGRLEVDHIIPVRAAPERAYDLTNLQTLCSSCHSRKTRVEIGLGSEPNPRRLAWGEAVSALMPAAKRKHTGEKRCLIL